MDDTRVKIRADEKQKCTMEQFWAVATLSVNAFLLARDPLFPNHAPCWVILPVVLLDTLAITYIFRRARAYAQIDRRLNNLLHEQPEEDGVADITVSWRDIWGGTGLYSLLIFFSCIAVIEKYCHIKT